MKANTARRRALGQEHIRRFSEQLSDPVHKRLIEAYSGDDPVESMEAELGRVLEEVLSSEDQ